MCVSIAGRQMYLWRAIDDEGEVLAVLATTRRDKNAPVLLMHNLLKKHQRATLTVLTDRLRPFGGAIKEHKLCPHHVMDKKGDN